MTFKRIHGSIHEIVFSTYLADSEGNSVVSLARIYVNKNTVKMYHKSFTMLFQCLGNGVQKPMWKHIHGNGFEGVTADMCMKQAEGLGKYLEDLDASRSWREHIEHVLVFCLVHYNRDIRPHRAHSQYQAMRELPFMSSRQQVLEWLSTWKLDSEIGGWVKHKSCAWILSGLNPVFSKIDDSIFKQIQRHTNTGESGHAHVNRTGIHRSLLGGMLSARQYDNAILQRSLQHQLNNVPPSSRSKNALARHQRTEQRFGSQNMPITVPEEQGTPTSAGRKRTRTKNESKSEIDIARERAELRVLELTVKEKELELREWELRLKEREIALNNTISSL